MLGGKKLVNNAFFRIRYPETAQGTHYLHKFNQFQYYYCIFVAADSVLGKEILDFPC